MLVAVATLAVLTPAVLAAAAVVAATLAALAGGPTVAVAAGLAARAPFASASRFGRAGRGVTPH